jgi:hypothetical protein
MEGKLGGMTYIDIVFIGSRFLDYSCHSSLAETSFEAIFLVDKPEELRTRMLSF